MLVLSRKLNQIIRIGDDISVKVISLDAGVVKLGIDAPGEVAVHRSEVYERIQDENRLAAQQSPGQLPLLAKWWREHKDGKTPQWQTGGKEKSNGRA